MGSATIRGGGCDVYKSLFGVCLGELILECIGAAYQVFGNEKRLARERDIIQSLFIWISISHLMGRL